jgi:hypothetical protein
MGRSLTIGTIQPEQQLWTYDTSFPGQRNSSNLCIPQTSHRQIPYLLTDSTFFNSITRNPQGLPVNVTRVHCFTAWRSESSGMYFRVLNWMSTDVSEVREASIIRAMSEYTGLLCNQWSFRARLTHRPDDGGSTHLWNVVDIQLRTRQYIPEDSDHHTRRRENLKSHTYHSTQHATINRKIFGNINYRTYMCLQRNYSHLYHNPSHL